MNINEQIYRNVKALTKIHCMELKDVEGKIGNTAGYLSRKNRKINVDTLVKLSDIFEVSTDELMYGDFERELKQKTALHNLREAVIEAKDYINEDGLMTFVENAIRAGGDA